MATATRTSARLPEAKNVGSALERALSAGKGILRLSPTWVPRSFLHPGKRVRLHPDDYYAYGLDRGGIDERWFASTTEAANEGRVPDEGLSWCVFDGPSSGTRPSLAASVVLANHRSSMPPRSRP